VDAVTQRNAASAEELASTAVSLASQAESLRQMIGFFRVRASEHAAPAPGVVAPERRLLARPSDRGGQPV